MSNHHKKPTHIAIIADGNRRWAKEKGLPTMEGHRKGYERVNELVHTGRKLGIKIMTFWVFSTENWKRTKEEVGYLMKLFDLMIEKHKKEAHENKTRMIHLGRKDRLPESLRNKIESIEKETAQYSDFYLCIGIDYGGEDEIIRVYEHIQKKDLRAITHTDIYSSLDTKNLPQQEVDLLIRTSGEQRTSGFLPLQTAYAEFYFSSVLFPDFDSKALMGAVDEFAMRKRRFGQ